MKSALATAVVVALVTAGMTAAIVFLYGGGGVAIPGAAAVLVVNAGLVGFLAGLIAAISRKS